MNDQDLRELNKANGSTCTEGYTVDTPDGIRHLGIKFNIAPRTNQNDNLEVGRIAEATSVMLYHVFRAWDAEKAVGWNDVYDCVFERQPFKEIQIQKPEYVQALKNAAYIHLEGEKIWSHLW